MKIIKENRVLLFSIFLFLILTLPFVNTIPYLDGNIDFVQTVDFYNGGINQYFSNWNTVHPPLKLLLVFPFYSLLGISPFSYSLVGVSIGILGIVSIYFLTKDLFGKTSANFSAILFSLCPLFIANSIFSMRDSTMTVLILLSLLFYTRKKIFFYGVASSLAVLTKESALLLPLIIVFVEIIGVVKNKKTDFKKIFPNFILFFIPIVIYYIWKMFLNSNGKNSWNEWIFAETESKGTIYTIMNNLITFDFINPYALQHWKQLFFLNFNWVYILIILLGFSIYIVRNKRVYSHKDSRNQKTMFAIFLFIISYFLTVLSLQTYTIPRYALPLIPFIIIFLAKSIVIINNLLIKYSLYTVTIILFSTSLFSSIDPIATRLWGKTNIFNNQIYALNDHLAGNDGITYNIQYLFIASARSKEILKADKENKNVTSNYCQWIFPDPNNDIKMLKALNLKIQPKCFYSN